MDGSRRGMTKGVTCSNGDAHDPECKNGQDQPNADLNPKPDAEREQDLTPGLPQAGWPQ